MEIPEWKLQRFMKVEVEPIGDSSDQKLTISAVDSDGIDATVFRDVELQYNGKPVTSIVSALSNKAAINQYKFRVSNQMIIPVDDQKENENESESDNASAGLVVELSFMGNYSEPNLCIPLCPLLQDLGSNDNDNGSGGNEFVCRLLWDVKNREWKVEPLSADVNSPYEPLKIYKRPKDNVEDAVKEETEPESTMTWYTM